MPSAQRLRNKSSAESWRVQWTRQAGGGVWEGEESGICRGPTRGREGEGREREVGTISFFILHSPRKRDDETEAEKRGESLTNRKGDWRNRLTGGGRHMVSGSGGGGRAAEGGQVLSLEKEEEDVSTLEYAHSLQILTFQQFGAQLNATDWDTIETITHDSSRNTETAVRETQIRKFEKLSDRQHPSSLGHGPEKDRSVINFTDYQLTNAHISILSKGLNFAIAPTKIPKEEIVTEVEYAIRKLPKGDADEIREDVARILRNARPPKMNITGAERRALSDLRGNENILILPADKGNSTVLMKRGDYEMKISRMLEDSTYRKLRSDPTAKAERDTRALIKNSTIPREHQTRLFPSAAKPPRLYGLPKVHKEGVPLRPIVSQIDGPTYRLSKYLAQSLQPYVGQTSSFVRDSTHFIEILKKITISPNDILVSFDVASLFTNVPIQESVDIIKELTKSGIPEDHPQLIEPHILSASTFVNAALTNGRRTANKQKGVSVTSIQLKPFDG
ncbi:uncharacterized protein [Hetaerina americana]|uniref:uncharacterized protein n=1 Tax=Hetaerina americana TaxID=62018 RepID=UPI003A7F1A8E